MRVVTFKIDEYTFEKLEDYARAKGISRSEAIRRGIELLLRMEAWKVEPKPKIVRLTS